MVIKFIRLGDHCDVRQPWYKRQKKQNLGKLWDGVTAYIYRLWVSISYHELREINTHHIIHSLASFLYESFLLAMLSYRIVGSMHHVRILQVMFRDGLWAYTLVSCKKSIGMSSQRKVNDRLDSDHLR